MKQKQLFVPDFTKYKTNPCSNITSLKYWKSTQKTKYFLIFDIEKSE